MKSYDDKLSLSSTDGWESLKRDWKATGKGAGSVAVKAPKLKGVTEVETWYHLAKSESLKRSQKLLVKEKCSSTRRVELV